MRRPQAQPGDSRLQRSPRDQLCHHVCKVAHGQRQAGELYTFFKKNVKDKVEEDPTTIRDKVALPQGHIERPSRADTNG